MLHTNDIELLIADLPIEATCYGYCADCDEVHYLTEGNSREYALELIAELEEKKRIDFHSPDPQLIFSTDSLWETRGGQMFGVLECVDAYGKTVVLRAFSGQFNAHWLVEGWVQPAFDLDGYYQLLPEIEASIQKMTDDIEVCRHKAEQCKLQYEKTMDAGDHGAQIYHRRQMREAYKTYEHARKIRKTYSQSKMFVFQDLYQLQNFKGEKRSILKAFYEERGIPIGSGDCCGPKLLHAAAQKGLTPLGLSEFYFGKTNKSSTKHHKEFYLSCKNKCQPILGYMLCGL
ncbi:hypothetical protein [Desulforhopalus sp. 52FAK]